MNRVTKRTWMMGMFLVVLLVGMSLFLWEYFTQAPTWLARAGGAHSGGTAQHLGIVVDRWGSVLLDTMGKKTYSVDSTTRKSTLHWLGDRGGNISSKVISHYASNMLDFNLVNGTYDAAGVGGLAVFTLSSRVQNVALNALAGRKGTVAVYNYKTGEILCAVTAPTYDPDNVPDISADTTGSWGGVYLNRFVQSAYPPGSIFKIITCAAALETVPGIEDMVFTCYGKHAYGKEAVTCETAHGSVNLMGALANSCNCAFAQIAEKVGRANMQKYVRQFQITEPVRFDGLTTASGRYDIADTGPASFAWSCIGQHSDLINPCRFLYFMGMIAGGGKAAAPHLVREVSNSTSLTYQAETVQSERIMSEVLARTMQAYMRNNVEKTYGSWNFPGLTVCAKSGTAELGGNQVSNAMFAGFVTDAQYPLAFICIVENGGYGANTCVPVLSKVLAECKTVMDLEHPYVDDSVG